jgi:hypothetical protein
MLFERGFVVLETALSGKPIGAGDWLESGEFAEGPIGDLGKRVQELADLDARNVLIPVDQVSAARLRRRRFPGVWVLRLSLQGGGEMSFFWANANRAYANMASDGSLTTPRKADAALEHDLRSILGRRLVGE